MESKTSLPDTKVIQTVSDGDDTVVKPPSFPRVILWRSILPIFVLIVSMCVVAGCGTESERVFDEFESPDGSYRLRLTVAEPRLPHGRFRVRAYVLKNGDDMGQKALDEKLENDGVPFTSQNLAVRWTSARAVLVCLRTTDLPDLGFRIDIVENFPQVEIIARC